MKKFEVTAIKKEKLTLGRPTPAILTRQIINTDKDSIELSVPIGFEIVSVCEILPEININNNVPKIAN